MVPPGQNDVSSDDVIFSRSPSPVSGVSLLIQADQPLTQPLWGTVGVVDSAKKHRKSVQRRKKRDRQTETETDRDRETDRQTDRQTDMQTLDDTDRQRDRG